MKFVRPQDLTAGDITPDYRVMARPRLRYPFVIALVEDHKGTLKYLAWGNNWDPSVLVLDNDEPPYIMQPY